MKIVEGTVDLVKDIARPVDIVYAAWSTEQSQLSWCDPGEGWELHFDHFRFKVGQTDICRFGPVGGQCYINENRYLQISAGERIVYSTSLVSNGRLTFAGTVAVTFMDAEGGTRLHLVEQGLYFDELDDVASHCSGWESMLQALNEYVRRERA